MRAFETTMVETDVVDLRSIVDVVDGEVGSIGCVVVGANRQYRGTVCRPTEWIVIGCAFVNR